MGVMHAMKAHVAGLAATLDLTPSQLAALSHLDEPQSQRELAESLHFDASNITDIVDRLEARGLVVRTVDPNDRRVRRIVRTPEGEELRRAGTRRSAGHRADGRVAQRERAADALRAARQDRRAGRTAVLATRAADQSSTSSSVVVIFATSESVFLMITSV